MKTHKDETNEHNTKTSTVDDQNNFKMIKLKYFLEEIAKQHKIGKSQKLCCVTDQRITKTHLNSQISLPLSNVEYQEG